MNHLILNRDFGLPKDGYYHIAPMGEYAHADAGIIQVIDTEACAAMAARFATEKTAPNFPGLLIDFDHFSLDNDQRSEAAGWLLDLEARDTGLWANIRWSDTGQAAVTGGRYRFLSPVWARSDCVDLGNGRYRPQRLLNAAVTNDPNLKGMVPLTNRSTELTAGRGGPLENPPIVETVHAKASKGDPKMKTVIERLLNHLGLAADAKEDVILASLATMPTPAAFGELQTLHNSLKTTHDALVLRAKELDAEVINRHLTEFAPVISDATRPFWADQLLNNRASALVTLADMVKAKAATAPAPTQPAATPRQPLHNRATARPVIPAADGSPSDETTAVKIRNRAQEIAKSEGIPVSVAFRRAEKELVPA